MLNFKKLDFDPVDELLIKTEENLQEWLNKNNEAINKLGTSDIINNIKIYHYIISEIDYINDALQNIENNNYPFFTKASETDMKFDVIARMNSVMATVIPKQ